jgi:hypothetical protein
VVRGYPVTRRARPRRRVKVARPRNSGTPASGAGVPLRRLPCARSQWRRCHLPRVHRRSSAWRYANERQTKARPPRRSDRGGLNGWGPQGSRRPPARDIAAQSPRVTEFVARVSRRLSDVSGPRVVADAPALPAQSVRGDIYGSHCSFNARRTGLPSREPWRVPDRCVLTPNEAHGNLMGRTSDPGRRPSRDRLPPAAARVAQDCIWRRRNMCSVVCAPYRASVRSTAESKPTNLVSDAGPPHDRRRSDRRAVQQATRATRR